MAQDKVNMPMSSAGLTRMSDVSSSKMQMAPGHVIVVIALVMAFVLLLHVYGKTWFGL